MNNLKGELLILDINKIKPNYSALARLYNKDRRTIKKEHEGLYNETNDTTRKVKESILDKYKDLIKEKLSIPGTNKKAVYMYLKMNIDDNIGTYSNFRKYVKKHADELIPKNNEIHLRFETQLLVRVIFL